MVDTEDLNYNQDFGEFEIIQKLTSSDPVERHTAMRLVANFERMLNCEDTGNLTFERLFRDSRSTYEHIISEGEE